MCRSPRGWQERIQDILDAWIEIQEFVTNIGFTEFQNDLKTLRAVELDLIIIGEAANAIPEEVQKAYPEIAWQSVSTYIFLGVAKNTLGYYPPRFAPCSYIVG